MAVILVADDEAMIRDFVSTVLQADGHQVMTAVNGLEAVALFRSYRDRISLVITDIRMPVMDGNQVVKLVREARRDARIVCMTGFAETIPEDVQILAKPFLPGALRECVDQALAAK
jgi:CheY-like chemotaxis protein